MIQSEEEKKDGKKRTETKWLMGQISFNIHDI